MKDKIMSALGSFGVIIWYVASAFIYILPIAMIGKGFLLNTLFFVAMYFFPPSSVVFWVWGLFKAIAGPQDVFAIIYYILSVVVFLPFFIDTLLTLFNKERKSR